MLVTERRPTGHRPPGAASAPVRRSSHREAVELGAFAVLAVGAVWVERHGAGRDGFSSVAPGLVACVPLILACRAWLLPRGWLAAAAALPGSIVATAALAPGGWAGAERSAAYGYGSLAFVALVAFATTPGRRLAAAVGLALVVLDQFAQSWLAWWGSADPTQMQVGSFYLHNQFGAFCAAGVAVCAVLALTAEPRRLRTMAVLVASVVATGLLGSASRASVLLAGFACSAALLLAVRAVGLVWAVGRAAGLAAASLAVGVFLRSPLFFPTWSWPWVSLVGRTVRSAGDASYESVTGNATSRLGYWKAGLELARERPLVGNGLTTFGDGSRWYLPPGAMRSFDPHDELIRGAAEGGVVGALPLLVVLVLSAALAVAHLRRHWTLPSGVDPGALAGLLGAGVLVCHALVDFDWSYPALVMASGWCLALPAAATTMARGRPPSRAGRSAGAALVSLALVAALAGAGVAARSRDALVAAAAPGVAPSSAQAMLRGAWLPAAPDHRLPALAVTLALGAGDAAPPWTVGALRARATVDAQAAVALSRAELSLGRRTAALQRLRALAARDPARAPSLVKAYADLLAVAGSGPAGTQEPLAGRR